MITSEIDSETIHEESDSLEQSTYPTVSSQTTPPPLPPPKGLNRTVPPTPDRLCNHFKYRCNDRQITPTPPMFKETLNASTYEIHSSSSSSPHHSSTRENRSFIWVTFSSVYGKLIILLTVVLCVTEIVNNETFLMQYQSFFFLYLYLGSALIIVCIYVYIVLSNGPSPGEYPRGARDFEITTINSFGTLRKAYIKKSHTARTSFHLRVGALVFGLATLIHTGLEIAVHTTVEIPCIDEIAFVHPILQAIFTFLQMHFLFVNSQIVMDTSGAVARVGFMHLIATNLAVWIRMVTIDGALEEARVLFQNSTPSSPETVSSRQMAYTSNTDFTESSLRESGNHDFILVSILQKGKLRAFYNCLHQSSLGRMWMEAVPFLFPFILQFCFVAAAVFFVMWRHIGVTVVPQHIPGMEVKSRGTVHDSIYSHEKACPLTHRGLFLGLLVLVHSIVLLVIFFVMQAKPEFSNRLIWISVGTSTGVLIVATATSITGLIVIKKLTRIVSRPLYLDRLLTNGTTIFVYFHGLLLSVAGGALLHNDPQVSGASALLMVNGFLTVLHAAIQTNFLEEAGKRRCTTNGQLRRKPGQQVLTALLCCNAALWLIDGFLTASREAQYLQASFYGPVLWGFFVRINLPIIALNRFHSSVMIFEIWKMSYSKKV